MNHRVDVSSDKEYTTSEQVKVRRRWHHSKKFHLALLWQLLLPPALYLGQGASSRSNGWRRSVQQHRPTPGRGGGVRLAGHDRWWPTHLRTLRVVVMAEITIIAYHTELCNVNVALVML